MEQRPPTKTPSPGLMVTSAIIVLLGLAAAWYLLSRYDLSGTLKEYLQGRIPPLTFLVLMLLLPLFGAPLSVFLVLVGGKFGPVGGTVLTAILMLCHMVLTYGMAHSFLRRRVKQALRRLNVSIPRLGREYNLRHAVIFMLVPGLPYAVKNNLLALTNIPFVPYVLVNWTCQFTLSIPLIILGGAIIDMNPLVLVLAMILILAGYFGQRALRKKYRTAARLDRRPKR